MTYTLSLRPRALGEIAAARRDYAAVGHGESFLDELDSVFHRALLKRYPFAVFFRIRPNTQHIVVLAVFPQRADPARWPKR